MAGSKERMPMRGRPGTRALPLGNARAIGGPVRLGLVGAYFAVALAGWAAAAVALLLGADDVAAGRPLAELPVLATHLLALGFLAPAVTAAAFHLLPVMLRNDIARPRLLQLALPLLCGGFLVAPGVAYHQQALLWAGASLLAAGLALVLLEVLGLVWRAPRGRALVASRTGVALTMLHVAAALVLGALAFSAGTEFAGVPTYRWILVHLHLGVLGWITLLIVTVGRTLGPMLAAAPTPGPRRRPATELAFAAGLWALLAGLAAGEREVALGGVALMLLALVVFGTLVVRIARTRRLPLEAPLAHMVAGVAFLAQAAVLGIGLLGGWISLGTGLVAYVLVLLLGWGAGVTLGHLGKLLSLSIWVWWPPGPRPKQEQLYPRRLWLAETVAFAAGTQTLAAGALAGSTAAARAGGAVLVAAALLAAAGAAVTWSQRAR